MATLVAVGWLVLDTLLSAAFVGAVGFAAWAVVGSLTAPRR